MPLLFESSPIKQMTKPIFSYGKQHYTLAFVENKYYYLNISGSVIRYHPPYSPFLAYRKYMTVLAVFANRLHMRINGFDTINDGVEYYYYKLFIIR